MREAATIFATAVGAAEGSRGAAAALACSGAEVDLATLLIDLGGRAPRPTLLASAAARELEERLAAHLPAARVAARGQVCHLAVPVGDEGYVSASAAATVGRGGLVVMHLAPAQLRELLDRGIGPRPTGVLIRADVAAERPLLTLAVRDLLARGLAVAVLKHRLGWVAERRALFGALPPRQAGGLPASVLRKLMSHQCYAAQDDPGTDPTRAAQPERGDHARTGPR